MKKRWLAGLISHQYEKVPVTMKMWMQFNVMPWTSLGVDTAHISSQVCPLTPIGIFRTHIQQQKSPSTLAILPWFCSSHFSHIHLWHLLLIRGTWKSRLASACFPCRMTHPLWNMPVMYVSRQKPRLDAASRQQRCCLGLASTFWCLASILLQSQCYDLLVTLRYHYS